MSFLGNIGIKFKVSIKISRPICRSRIVSENRFPIFCAFQDQNNKMLGLKLEIFVNRGWKAKFRLELRNF